MNSESFVTWLRGYFDLRNPNADLSPEELEVIEAHLKLVEEQKLKPPHIFDSYLVPGFTAATC